MGLFHYLWSRTAASNSTADANVNWAEGQAPSSVNDSARAMMASAAAFRDDIAGAITTGGTSTAYTVASYQIFDSLAHMSGQIIAFTPHATNGATVTLNVDGLGAKPLRSSPSVELPAGVLILGTPYVALYNNSDAVWYLQNFYINPYSIPIAGSLDYWGATAPNSAFALAYGQAISRTTYSALFAITSTTYGAGDGSTTFNLPDVRGRLVAGKDDMGGSAASRMTATYFGTSAAALGATGGAQATFISINNINAFTPTVLSTSLSAAVPTSGTLNLGATGSTTNTFPLGNNGTGASTLNATVSGTITMNSLGAGTALGILPPAIIANKLLRVI